MLKNIISNNNKRYITLLWRNIAQSLQYYLLDANFFRKKPPRPKIVIFVCKGNICRSAFAEIRYKLNYSNKITVSDSCGLDVEQGSYPPPEAVLTAKEYSCEQMAQRRSKSIKDCDLQKADLILAMEYEQYKYLKLNFPNTKDKVRLLRQYAPGMNSLFCNINDPFSWGEKEFRKTFKLIDNALKNI